MSDHTKLVRTLYAPYIDEVGCLGISGILLEVDGVLVDIDTIPDEFVKELLGLTKEELMDAIANEVYLDFFKD